MKDKDMQRILSAIEESQSKQEIIPNDSIKYVLDKMTVLEDRLKVIETNQAQIRGILIAYDKKKQPKASKTTRNMPQEQYKKLLLSMGITDQ